jgi:hypothetical protein
VDKKKHYFLLVSLQSKFISNTHTLVKKAAVKSIIGSKASGIKCAVLGESSHLFENCMYVWALLQKTVDAFNDNVAKVAISDFSRPLIHSHYARARVKFSFISFISPPRHNGN